MSATATGKPGPASSDWSALGRARRAEAEYAAQATLEACVAGLQRDAQLLLRHVARRPDRGLGTPAALDPDRTTIPAGMVEPAASVATNPAAIAHLAAIVDDLSRRAAPTTATSLRLTSAYLGLTIEGGEPSRGVQAEASRLRWSMRWVRAAALVAFLVAVALLVHVDSGRRALDGLRAVDARIAALLTAGEGATLGAPEADRGAAVAFHLRRRCEDEPNPARTAVEDVVCDRYGDLLRKQRLAYLAVAVFNCNTRNVQHWRDTARRCKFTAAQMNAQEDLPPWRATEIRALQTIGLLTGFVLPMLLGLLGGAAYALRRFDGRLKAATVEARDGPHSIIRILLAAMLGGLLGLVWSPDVGVTIGAVNLSLAAAAFFVGFSLEVVFTTIETMVEAVAGKLTSQPPPTILITAPAFANAPSGGGDGNRGAPPSPPPTSPPPPPASPSPPAPRPLSPPASPPPSAARVSPPVPSPPPSPPPLPPAPGR